MLDLLVFGPRLNGLCKITGHFSYSYVILALVDEASFSLRSAFPSQKAYEPSDARAL